MRNVSATTDRNGNVFLLQAGEYNNWRIVSALPLLNNNQTHRVIAVGNGDYVKKQWAKFVENEKHQIATNYNALAAFNTRKTLSRA